MAAIMAKELNQEKPLYTRIPKGLHVYLDEIKNDTGISKSDSLTLILLYAQKILTNKEIVKMFEEYMLNGEELFPHDDKLAS